MPTDKDIAPVSDEDFDAWLRRLATVDGGAPYVLTGQQLAVALSVLAAAYSDDLDDARKHMEFAAMAVLPHMLGKTPDGMTRH